MFVFYARNEIHKLDSLQYEYYNKQVRIIGSDNCCDACRQLPKGNINTNKAPELPHVGCTSPSGCRCMFQPVTKSWDQVIKGK